MVSKDDMTTGKKIKALRLSRGLSQKKLGLLCGVSEPTIRHYELGLRRPSKKKLERIAAELQVSSSALYEWKIDTLSDIMQVLFEMERGGGVVIEKINGNSDEARYWVRFEQKDLETFLENWSKVQATFRNGDITEEEYQILKMRLIPHGEE